MITYSETFSRDSSFWIRELRQKRTLLNLFGTCYFEVFINTLLNFSGRAENANWTPQFATVGDLWPLHCRLRYRRKKTVIIFWKIPREISYYLWNIAQHLELCTKIIFNKYFKMRGIKNRHTLVTWLYASPPLPLEHVDTSFIAIIELIIRIYCFGETVWQRGGQVSIVSDGVLVTDEPKLHRYWHVSCFQCFQQINGASGGYTAANLPAR